MNTTLTESKNTHRTQEFDFFEFYLLSLELITKVI